MFKPVLLGLGFFGILIGGYLFAGVWGAGLALVAFGFLWFGVNKVKTGGHKPSAKADVDDEPGEPGLPAVELDIGKDGQFTDLRLGPASGIQKSISLLDSMPFVYRVAVLERLQNLTEQWRQAGLSADEISRLTDRAFDSALSDAQKSMKKSQKIATTRKGREYDEYDIDDGTPGLGDILKAVLRRR